MKIIQGIVLCLLMLSEPLWAQSNNGADGIVGLWQTESKDGKIEIFKSGDRYCGKIIWGNRLYETDGKSRKDIHNPDPKLRSRLLEGLVFMYDFVFKGDMWDDGKVYDTDTGKTYSSSIKLKDGRLVLRGYIGIPLFGKSVTWDRVK